jgi:RNA-binding protein
VTQIKGTHKKYLRGLAHHLKPVVMIGRNGLTPAVLKSVESALDDHELIKVQFIDFKEKQMKTEISAEIETAAGCTLAGMIGHKAVFYRQHPDPEKRTIRLSSADDA